MWILDGLNLKVIENAGAVKNGKIYRIINRPSLEMALNGALTY